MTSPALDLAIVDALPSFITLKVPLVGDVIDIFIKSEEFKQMQYDNTHDMDAITSV